MMSQGYALPNWSKQIQSVSQAVLLIESSRPAKKIKISEFKLNLSHMQEVESVENQSQ